MNHKPLPTFCFRSNLSIIFSLILFISFSVYAQTPKEWLPTTPDYEKNKVDLITKVSDSTINSKPPKYSANLPSCFEAFSNTGADGWQMAPRNDDGSYGPVDLGWDFSLYGTIYNSVYINTNGNITFLNPLTTFTPTGLPISIPMIAAFWADVDTRSTGSGSIWYKVFSDRLVITWDHVGYYNTQSDKTNTFQMIIYANTSLSFVGNDVIFAYDDMQWTTGSASSGVGGFGGAPATVGANHGNGVDYIQTGRFNINSSDPPNNPSVGSPGGVSWLDGKCIGYVVRGYQGNIPPSVAGFPSGGIINIYTGQTLAYNFQFSGPEVTQTIDINYNLNNLCSTTLNVTGNNTSNPNIELIISGNNCNLGQRTISLTATDDGVPVQSESFDLTVNVSQCPSPLPIIADTTICNNTSVTLIATGCSGVYKWYESETSNIIINQTGTFTTPLLNTNTDYFISCTENSCEGLREQVNILINPLPIVSNITICTGTSATLTATGCTGTYRWYDNNTTLSILATTPTFTTPTLTVNKSYFVSCWRGTCESNRSQATVTITPLPNIPAAINKTICIGNAVLLTATGCSGNYKWYDTTTSIAILASTANYTTPSLMTSRSYYVSCTQNNCESSRKKVDIIVEAVPNAPSASGTTICAGNTTTLLASGCTGTYQWYASTSSTTVLASTASYTTPALATNTNYYVSCLGIACISNRTTVSVTVNLNSSAPAATNQSICSGTTTTLTASGCSGTYRWYSSNTSTTILASTATYVSPILTINTNYFVSCRINNCESNRTQVSVTINSTTTPPTANGVSICSGSVASLTASGCTGTYRWYSSNTSTTILVSTPTYTTPILLSNTNYYVSCLLNSCESSRTTVNISVNTEATQPSTSGVSICSGNTASLSASGCTTGTLRWYSSNTSTIILATTNSYTTPILTSNANYFVSCRVGTCESARSIVNITVIPPITAPLSSNTSICKGSSASLTASGCSGTFRWYSSNTSTIILATTSTYTTSSNQQSDADYYVSCRINNCESNRTKVSVTINSIPNSPTANSVSVCSGNSASFTASGCSGTYGWYTNNNSATPLSNTATYTTNNLVNNTSYYVGCKQNGCESNRVQVYAIVIPVSLILTGNAPSGSQQATQTISSTQAISIGTDAIYKAGNGITLNPGFNSNLGSVFLAKIESCN